MLVRENPQLSDAFSQEAKKSDSAYSHVLDMEDSGVMGALEIPKISLYLPIYHGTSQEVLEKGIGHLEGTSIPIGGKNTHAVLTGHRGLPSAELFSNLDQLERNDEFYIHILGKTLAYKVFQVETVKPEDTGHLTIAKGQDRVTLVTCTPYGLIRTVCWFMAKTCEVCCGKYRLSKEYIMEVAVEAKDVADFDRSSCTFDYLQSGA